MLSTSDLLAEYTPEVRGLALQLRDLVHDVIPDALEELDLKDRLLGFSFQPGTYKGLILAIAPQGSYVNVNFSQGVELMAVDSTGLLEGTGKVARHVKVRTDERVRDPALRALIEAAAARTPR
jgi:hypothetical protein